MGTWGDGIAAEWGEPRDPAGPARPRGVGRALVVLALAAVIPVLAAVSATARGPFYLEINIDPEYAYLLNALAVAEGHGAGHTDHPGSPVQVVGAGVIRVVGLFGAGPVRDQVLSRPEFFLRCIQVVLVACAAGLSALGGWLAWRGTGSWLGAAGVQLAPLLVWPVMPILDRVQPEGLVTGVGMALAGVVVAILGGRAPGREGRLAVAAGVLVAVGTACKFLFAPMALVPLAALATWRSRAAYVAPGALAFPLLVIPAWPEAGRTARWLWDLVWRTGPHGRGQGGVVVVSAYREMVSRIWAADPVYVVLLACSLGAGLVLVILTARGIERARPRPAARAMLAAALAQVLLLLAIAKHPAPHYLASAVGMAGLCVVLIAWGAGGAGVLPLPSTDRPERRSVARAGAVAAAGLALVLIGWRGTQLREWRTRLSRTVAGEMTTAAFLRSPEAAGVLHGGQVSSPESGLQFGNWYVHGRYGEDLARLWPRALGWDFKGVSAFGVRPSAELLAASELALLRGEDAASSGTRGREFPLRAFRAVVSRTATYRGSEELAVTIERAFGREWLVRCERVPEAARAFGGFEAVSGLGYAEGPYAWMEGAPIVRWGLSPATVLRFESPGGRARLHIEARPNNRPKQAVEVVLNGTSLHRHAFAAGFETVDVDLPARAGTNELELRYAQSERNGFRELCVLYRKLQVLPGGATVRTP